MAKADDTMTIAEAASILQLDLPTTLNVCKTTFRRLSRQEHPDLSKHPEAAARFGKIKAAYDFLLPMLESAGSQIEKLRTDQGVPLSELGKGLGPTVNGVACGECKGFGYRSFEEDGLRRCPDCFMTTMFAPRTIRCSKCRGLGRLVVDGVNKGVCFRCCGLGFIRNVCKLCGGEGFVGSAEPRLRYVRCEGCEGCGEVKIYNPVLPRGLLL
jgi:hypothetical protein